jgi:hypothetical protein
MQAVPGDADRQREPRLGRMLGHGGLAPTPQGPPFVPRVRANSSDFSLDIAVAFNFKSPPGSDPDFITHRPRHVAANRFAAR